MKNYLVYTISDFKNDSLKCIDLLYASLLYKNKKENFDFAIVSNVKTPENYNPEYNIIYEECNHKYIGMLKYSRTLPSGYKAYIYLDNDILFYEDVSNIIKEADFSLVLENKPMSDKWFCNPLATEEEKAQMRNIYGINAGSFTFKDVNFTNEVRKLYDTYDVETLPLDEQGYFEQSALNYTLFHLLRTKSFYNFKHIMLMPVYPGYEDEATYDGLICHKAFHFCGFVGTMTTKLERMQKVFQKYRFSRLEILQTLPKDMVWVELGVFLGNFSKEIYTYLKPKELYLVDIFPDYMVSGDQNGENVIYTNLTSIPDELNNYFKDDNVKIIKSTTQDFLLNLINNGQKVDAIYIDADHEYNSVKIDLELSYKVIKNGGYICGHDYHKDKFPGVWQAVNEFCSNNNLKIKLLSDDLLPSYVIQVEKTEKISINDFFDGIYWINTPTSVERKNKMQRFFDKYQIKANRIEGINGDLLRFLLNDTEQRNNARFYAGCLLSHLQAMYLSKVRGEKKILILEDDILPLKNFDINFDIFARETVSQSNDWDMIYLGFIPVEDNDIKWDYNLVLQNWVAGTLGYIRGTKHFTGAYAYALNEDMRDFLLEKLSNQKDGIYGVEAWLRDLARFHGIDYFREKKIYGYYPQLFAHDNGMSTTTINDEERLIRSSNIYPERYDTEI